MKKFFVGFLCIGFYSFSILATPNDPFTAKEVAKIQSSANGVNRIFKQFYGKKFKKNEKLYWLGRDALAVQDILGYDLAVDYLRKKNLRHWVFLNLISRGMFLYETLMEYDADWEIEGFYDHLLQGMGKTSNVDSFLAISYFEGCMRKLLAYVAFDAEHVKGFMKSFFALDPKAQKKLRFFLGKEPSGQQMCDFKNFLDIKDKSFFYEIFEDNYIESPFLKAFYGTLLQNLLKSREEIWGKDDLPDERSFSFFVSSQDPKNLRAIYAVLSDQYLFEMVDDESKKHFLSLCFKGNFNYWALGDDEVEWFLKRIGMPEEVFKGIEDYSLNCFVSDLFRARLFSGHLTDVSFPVLRQAVLVSVEEMSVQGDAKIDFPVHLKIFLEGVAKSARKVDEVKRLCEVTKTAIDHIAEGGSKILDFDRAYLSAALIQSPWAAEEIVDVCKVLKTEGAILITPEMNGFEQVLLYELLLAKAKSLSGLKKLPRRLKKAFADGQAEFDKLNAGYAEKYEKLEKELAAEADAWVGEERSYFDTISKKYDVIDQEKKKDSDYQRLKHFDYPENDGHAYVKTLEQVIKDL